MVNPGGFSGLRKKFLDDQQPAYNAAVEAKHAADTLADIQRRYFKRFPVTLSHNEDPTEEFIATVDDNAPDPELAPPDRANMDSEGYDRAKRVYEFQVVEIRMRKAQIKRRLHYNYNKTKNGKATFEIGSNDPMAILMSKLTGVGLQRPRMKTPYNMWGPQNRCFVDPVFAERVKENNVPTKNQAALRSSIYKELFEELPEDERQEWIERAEQEHQQALNKVDSTLKSGPSTAPEDRQRVIECLPRFLQPILDLIADHTGWKVTLLTGGPEPADGGRLNVVSVHAGVTSGSVKMNFGRSERVSYSDVILPVFGKFLRKCYSIQECRDRALPDNTDFAGLAEVGNLEGFDVHSLDDGSREGDGFVRMTAPGHQTPSIGVRAGPSSTRKSTSTSVQAAGTTSVMPPTPRQRKSLKTVPLKAPIGIKFGPPKGKQREGMAVDSAIERGASQALATAQPGDLEPSAATGVGCVSRGPTPPTSRPSTPMPSMTVDGRSSMHTAASAPAIGPSDAECTFPATSIRRATSAQPTPSLPAAITPSAVRAQSAMPSARAPSAAFGVSHLAAAAPAPSYVVTACAAGEFPAAAVASVATPSAPALPMPMPSATDPVQQSVDPAASVDGTGSNSPRIAEGPSAPAANFTLLAPHQPNVATNATPDPPPAEDMPSARSPNTVALTPSAPSATEQVVAIAPLQLLTGSIAVPDFEAGAQAKASRGSRKRKGAVITVPTAKKRKLLGEGPSPSSSGAADVPSVNGVGVWPDWVTKALSLLQSTPLGSEWDALLRGWLQFEQGTGFEDGPRLGCRRRPRIIADWIQVARKPKFSYEIKDPEKFAEEFNAWWRGLQPDWRLDDVSDLLRRDGEDWECLWCPGTNGLLSVVAALFFWGSRVQHGAPTLKSKWLEALEDVAYAISRL